MTQKKIVHIVNIGLVIANIFVCFAPKNPASGMHSNVAGVLLWFAIVMIGLFTVHLILVIIALFYNKVMLLKIMAIIMIPVSLWFWYLMVPLIKF